MPAEKGGLRRADVSQWVCCSFDFPLNFTMVMGSFTQKYVPIQTDQSGSREGMYGHKLTNQREGRVCKVKLTNQNFFNNFTTQGYKRRVTIVDMSVCLTVVSVNRG